MEMANKIALAALFAVVAVSVVMAQDEAPSPSPMADAVSAAGPEAASAVGSAASAVGSAASAAGSAASAMASAATPGAASSAATSLPALSSIIGFALISFVAQYLY